MKKLFSLLMVLLMTTFAFATDYIAGSFNGWSTSANALPATIRLAEGTYEFKIVLGGSSWVGNNGTMTRSNCSGWTFDGNQGNCKITADMTGDYVFTWASNKLTVTYPTTPAALTYYVTGTENLVGKDKAWNVKAIEMNEGTHTFTALGAGEYEMKVTDGTNWYGYEKLDAEKSSKGLSNKGGNIGFEIETSSDVTVSFDGKAIVVTGTFKQPEPAKEMVIYYVNTTNWEKVNAYLWTPEEATWPGKAMTKEKEQINGYDVYSHTTTDVYDGQNIIFSNNGSNQTDNLTIDAETPYYYDGKWYKKEDIPQPAKTFDLTIVQDSLWSKDGAKVAAWIWGKDLAGQWTAWATNNNDTLTLKVNENADSIIFKRFAPEVEVPYWEGSAEYQWNRIDAGEINECHLFIITNWNEGVWCERPVKCEPGYAIMVNGERHVLTLNAEQKDYTEYWIDSLELKVNDEIVLFDTCAKVTFKVAVKGYEGLKPVGESDTLKVTEEAYYQFYLKLIYGGDELYVVKLEEPAKTFDLTIVQDTLWSKAGAKVAAWIWGKDLAGQWTAWATNNNDTLTLKVNENADSIIFKRFAPEVEVPYWEGSAEYQWNRIDAGEIDDCHLFIITDWNEGVWCERPVKCEPGYAIVVNGERHVLTLNAEQKDYTEYWIDSLELKVNDEIVLFDTCAKVTFKVAVKGYEGLKPVGESDTLKVTEEAYYQFYLKLIYGGDELYVVKLEEPAKTFDLTIVQDSLWSKDGAKVAAWIWGKDLAGQWTAWATNNNDTLTLKVNEKADSIIFKRFAPEVEVPYWEGSAEYQWNQIDAGEIDECHIYYILDWNAGAWCERPVVETKYYAKNNWNGAAAQDWSWLEMSATDKENIYMLDSVVFGGTGVNINTKEDDTDALWFAADAITVLDGLDGLSAPIPPAPQKRDTIIYAPARMVAPLETPTLLAGDTIKLFFNAADSTLSAAIVGRPEQPEPAKTFDLTIVQDTLWSKDGAKVAAWIWGKDLAGEWTAWATNNNDTLTLKVNEKADSIIFVRCANDAEVPTWEPWNRIDAGEIDECHTYYILDWNAGAWCERPVVETKYYLVGYINGANVGCEDDYETLPEEYKFVNGSLTTTFTQTSYVFVKTGDNNHWYLSENYVQPAKQVTAILANGMDYGEKVGVNANIEVTFTLTENADGTITLSYKEATAPTALEAIMLNGGLKKFMLDGQMYILRNNHLYNAAGNLLK